VQTQSEAIREISLLRSGGTSTNVHQQPRRPLHSKVDPQIPHCRALDNAPYPPSSDKTFIDITKATHFIVIDAEDLEDVPPTDVQIRTGAIDLNGNIQTGSGPTGAKEYIFNDTISVLGKIIWPPTGSPGLMAGYNATMQSGIDPGFNSMLNWLQAGKAIVEYFLEKYGGS